MQCKHAYKGYPLRRFRSFLSQRVGLIDDVPAKHHRHFRAFASGASQRREGIKGRLSSLAV